MLKNNVFAFAVLFLSTISVQAEIRHSQPQFNEKKLISSSAIEKGSLKIYSVNLSKFTTKSDAYSCGADSDLICYRPLQQVPVISVDVVYYSTLNTEDKLTTQTFNLDPSLFSAEELQQIKKSSVYGIQLLNLLQVEKVISAEEIDYVKSIFCDIGEQNCKDYIVKEVRARNYTELSVLKKK